MGNGYLAAYNTILCLAWGCVLYLTVYFSFVHNETTFKVYRAVELPLMVAQTAAIMEVIHSLLGMVRSPAAITAMQVASRLWILWGIVVPLQEQTLGGAIKLVKVGPRTLQLDFISLMVAWCLSEIIRYSFFALKEFGVVPYFLLWLRYSAFIILYPLGVASELTMVYLAMPTIRSSHMWSLAMPNKLNISFDYHQLCVIICIIYVPGLPRLYGYMMKQRIKMLSPTKAAAGKTKKE
mmetsp:Transcript_31069/g.68975  ORF Transcript_31069/g.68975 Transcript_31069/m.68975 type:complete len:237 (+) Transcript_31069:60-770(+)|eukprot:CAMPEP_0202893396 /NCGR_PEP_ID=MMETSP1392-20130828/2988_1 /ASSEMBLY_ACC=CAM_ASM_000868 /TAXON_ID=225041 /ORGANISM="Chlamydomonas chlamydogama, Strain SAG 11-48b" /LENGTH=236 /DNA_ID=CAMNT_0049577709 /DNA_START=55 /DNA_END=765 /DNA_ORIENTATION=-